LTSDYSVLYSINSKGLRDKEYAYNKSNKTRFIVLGDSFTFGEGIAYGGRYTDIPEMEISNIEIINLGVPGFGLDNELEYLRFEGLKYFPDYVIIYLNSVDILRVIKNIESSAQSCDEKIPKTFFVRKKDLLNNLLIEKSYLFSYLYYFLAVTNLQKEMRAHDQSLWDCISNQDRERSKNIIDSEIRDTLLFLINEFKNLIKSNHIKKLVIINIDIYNNFSYLVNISDDTIYYDLSADLRNESTKYKLDYEYDAHYNHKANEYIGKKTAEIITNILKQ
jgi:hypothetical protein